MKLLDSQTGKSYEFPDDVSEQEVQQFLQRERSNIQKVPLSELREQPSALQEAIQPGGLASPENVGALSGGLMGASYGAAFGPVGAALGGVAGAGLGALTGRAGEVLSRQLYGQRASGPVPGTVPLEMHPQPTLSQDVADIGAASQRGMIAEAMGQIGGRALVKGVGVLAEPFVGRVDPSRATPKTFREVQERARLNASAEKLGIPTSAGVQTKHRGVSLLERMTEDVPLGVQPAEEFTKVQRQAIETAIDDFTGALAPRTMRDALTSGQSAQAAKLARQEKAEQAASRLYNNVAELVGDQKFTAENLREAGARLTRVEQELSGFTTPSGARMSQLQPNLSMVPEPQPQGFGPAGPSIRNVTPALQAQQRAAYEAGLQGVDELGTAAETQSLSAFVRSRGGVPLAREGFTGEQRALLQSKQLPGLFNREATHTIEEIAQQAREAGYPIDPNDLQGSFMKLLEQDARAGGNVKAQVFANPARRVSAEFTQWAEEGLGQDAVTRAQLREVLGGGKYRDLEHATQVAIETGDDALLRAVNQAGERMDLSPLPLQRSETGTLAQKLGLTRPDYAVDPNKLPGAFVAEHQLDVPRPLSFQTLREIQSRLGELARNAGQAGQRRVAGQYKMLFRAVTKDIEAIGETIPEVGPALQQANTFYRTKVVAPFFQDFFTKGKRAFDNADPQDVAAIVFRPGVSQQHVQLVKEAVGPKAYDGMLAAHMQESVSRAVNPQTGQFEVGRFLTQWGPKQYRDTSLQEMFGQRYADFRELRDVLQNIQDSALGAANPSGTGRRIGTAGQFTGIISFALNNPGATVGGLIGGALGKKAYGDAGMIAGGLAGGVAGNYLGGELDLLPGGEYAGGLATAGGIVALSPIGLSRILFHPQGIKWLTTGLQVSPGTETALKLSARLIALANKPTPAEASPVEELRNQIEEKTGKRVVSPPKTFREALQGMTVQ